MTLRILFVGGPEEWLEATTGTETRVEARRFGAGIDHLDYAFYEHLAAHRVIEHAVEAEREGFDAVVIGCFFDPGLRAARELVEIPVVGVGQAGLHVAAMLSAGRFSVLVGEKKWIPQLTDAAMSQGLETRLASWRALGLAVPEMKDAAATRAAVLREARAAVEEDGAEVVCLGCTGLREHARFAQDELGVPVLDPVAIGLAVAELHASLWKRFGISHSKAGGYASPPPDELAAVYAATYGKKRGPRLGKNSLRRR